MGRKGTVVGQRQTRGKWVVARWDAPCKPKTTHLTWDVWFRQPSTPEGLQRRKEAYQKKKKKKEKRKERKKQLHVACQIRMVTKSDSEITEGNTENGGTETQSKFSGKGKTKRADILVPRRKTTVMAPAGWGRDKGTGGHLPKVSFHEVKIILEIKPRPS